MDDEQSLHAEKRLRRLLNPWAFHASKMSIGPYCVYFVLLRSMRLIHLIRLTNWVWQHAIKRIPATSSSGGT
jgi:hypothetical protein